MFQKLDYDLGYVLTAVEDAGLFESRCTIQRRADPPSVDALGQSNMTTAAYSTVVLQDIPCMKAVWRTRPDIAAVTRTEDRFDTLTERHTLLDGWYPQIQQKDLAVITDYDSTGVVSVVTTYEIMAVEHDSQGILTRLALRTFVL